MLFRRAASRPSLRFQLLALLMGGLAVSLSISLGHSLFMTWDLQKVQLARALETTARSVAIAASAAVAFDDERAAADALSILAPQQEVDGAAVFTLDGRRLVAFGNLGGLPRDVRHPAPHGPDLSPLSRASFLLMPIELDGSTLGYLYLHANLEQHRAHFLRHALLAALTSLLALALVLWMGFRFIDRTTRPLLGLAALARRVRESRDPEVPVEPATAGAASREVEELVQSFHAMLAELRARARALAGYRRELEEKVRARTWDLAESNAVLTLEVAMRKANEARIQASEAQLQLQKQAAEEANQAKSHFLAAASHDLRQPMHAMGLLVTALKARLASLSPGRGSTELREVQRLASLVEASIQSMGGLLKDLLDLSRLEAGVVVPEPDCVSLGRVFGRLDERLAPLAEEKGLRLRFVDTRLAVTTDPLLLERILGNLIENAVRYTARGGVLVGVRRRGPDALRVEVVDSGVGIPEGMSGKVFEEYVQLDNPERDRRKGLGLGLNIVKRLCALLAIPVRLQSRVGHGSRFSLELPRCEARASDQAAEPSAPAWGAAGAPRLVVLIDNDEVILAAVRALLEPWNLDLIAEPSLAAALAALDARGQRPDLILSDYRLPGELDGVGVVERLRARYGQDVPGALVTGETGQAALTAIARSGLTLLHKPLQPAKLRAVLTHLLK